MGFVCSDSPQPPIKAKLKKKVRYRNGFSILILNKPFNRITLTVLSLALSATHVSYANKHLQKKLKLIASLKIKGSYPPQLVNVLSMKILTCNSNRPLAEQVASLLGIPLTNASVKSFADKEIFVEIHESIRGEDVFVIQSTSFPTNDHLMELLITLDALKRGSVRRITAVIPYFGYARQDRKTGPRTPISAKLVANLLTEAGADRILTCDLHTGQIQGFFDIPVDNLFTVPLICNDIRKEFKEKSFIIVSPDVGGVVRARAVAKKLGADLAIVDKRREQPGVSEVVSIIGNVKGRICILIDDIVDSAGTLCNAAAALIEAGAVNVYAYVSHGVLSGNAALKIESSRIRMLKITDSIFLQNDLEKTSKISKLTLAPLLADAIKRISTEQSVSCLFD